MNVEARYRLAPGVAIRPERFGGLVYRYDNRRLFFLHSHELVDFVSGLNGEASLGQALEEFLLSRSLPYSARTTFTHALTQLEKLGVLVPAQNHAALQATP